jgi:hypothetical protein
VPPFATAIVSIKHLHRRRQHVALADRHVVAVASRPRLGKKLALPLVGRHQRRHLAGQIDAGCLAKAKQLGPLAQQPLSQSLELL